MKTASLLLLQRNGSGNLDKSAEGEGRTLGIVAQDSGEKCGRDRDFLPVPGVKDPILFPTISIGPVGKRSNAAPCCFS